MNKNKDFVRDQECLHSGFRTGSAYPADGRVKFMKAGLGLQYNGSPIYSEKNHFRLIFRSIANL